MLYDKNKLHDNNTDERKGSERISCQDERWRVKISQYLKLASKKIVTKDSAIFAGLPVMPVQSLIAAQSPTSWNKLRTPPVRSKRTLLT
jgi:hypothetical protein